MTSTLSVTEQVKLYTALQSNAPMLQQAVSGGTIDLSLIKFHFACEAFYTSDPATLKVKEAAIKLAPRQEPVLITGESGTGKELLANILHWQRRGNFVAVNTCAITDSLFESELFGHERGAFTGADRQRNGLIKQTETERGEQGTLFLDEIGDMPLHLQPKLLRMIQNKVYRPVGSNVDETVKCRIIAATHQDLPSLVKQGKFRLDLYERLNVFCLDIPPLRQRPKDLEYFTNNSRINKEWLAKARLSGNIRQLLNLKLRAEVLGLDSIMEEQLQ